MLTAAAVLALGLCALGVYGVLAFSVTQRTREIGVRVAIGASRRQILRLVLRDAAAVIAIGLAVGLVLAWNSTQLMASLLFGIGAHDAIAFAAAATAIIVVSCLASYLPALRATRVAPLEALRVD